MKFSVGYRTSKSDSLVKSIIENKNSIYEVYFSWGDFANGRNSIGLNPDLTPWEEQNIMERDLKTLSDNGVSLNVLFNGMCYGKDSLSKSFFNKIGMTVDYLSENYSLSSVTTTSPIIAKFIKSNFKKIDVRASVNMGVNTVESFSYIGDYFDSFYLARELNRDFNSIKSIKSWCDSNGKSLHALANSGCLNHCSAHTFHDNLLAHEKEIAQMDNGFVFEGICHSYLSKKENKEKYFEITNFIRPEDTHHYEGMFDSLKLATRVSRYPVTIINAYIKDKSYSGNTLDLLEPSHSGVFYPQIISNKRIESVVDNSILKYKNINNALKKLEDDVYVECSND